MPHPKDWQGPGRQMLLSGPGGGGGGGRTAGIDLYTRIELTWAYLPFWAFLFLSCFHCFCWFIIAVLWFIYIEAYCCGYPKYSVHRPSQPLLEKGIEGLQGICWPPAQGVGVAALHPWKGVLNWVQPLTPFYTIFDRKGTPFIYFLLTNGNPFHVPSFTTLHPFNCCKCTVF